MISNELIFLAEKFDHQELHAAQGGRKVWGALISLITSSDATTPQDLLDQVQQNIIYLIKYLPPYAPPLNNINQILLYLETAIEANLDLQAIKTQANGWSNEKTDPFQNAHRIAQALLTVVPDHAVIYTHTLSETVLNSLLELNKLGKVGMVYVTESRPNNDGWETARRLAENGIQAILTIDAAMPMAVSQAQLMICGAEIIYGSGAVVGKVGAFPAAVFSTNKGNPVWILADSSKIWPLEVDNLNTSAISPEDLGLYTSHPFLKVGGSFFDRTPPEYITGYATEAGLLTHSDIRRCASRIQVSQWLQQQLSTRNQANLTIGELG